MKSHRSRFFSVDAPVEELRRGSIRQGHNESRPSLLLNGISDLVVNYNGHGSNHTSLFDIVGK